MTYTKQALLVGAVGSFAIAALHVVIIFVGAPGYRYFGAASLAPLAQQGSAYPALVTSAVALVFVVWGLFALSGAGVLAPFPFLRSVLAAIAAIYILRGVVFVPAFIRLAQRGIYPERQFVFAAVSLLLGVVYAVGFAGLRPRRVTQAAA